MHTNGQRRVQALLCDTYTPVLHTCQIDVQENLQHHTFHTTKKNAHKKNCALTAQLLHDG